jgi:ABC-2 type transport system ATP-binding protein
MLSIQNISKTYGTITALHEVSLNIIPGVITGLIGPNGAGKTTILRLISALIQPDSGSIILNDINIFKDPIGIKKSMSIVPTDSNLYPKLTLIDHLEFLKATYKIETKEFEKRKENLFSIMNFTTEPYALIETLSHGNQKKCLMCTAFIHESDVILLDEPLNGIDPISSKNIKEYLKHLAYNNNKIVIISSHIIESMEKLCDRILIIKDGEILDDVDAKKMREDEVDLENYFVEKISN